MASYLDALKRISSDRLSGVKIGILSLLPFGIYLYSAQAKDLTLVFYIISSILLLIYFGYILVSIKNEITEQFIVLPWFNVIKLFFVGVGGLFSALFGLLIGLLVYYLIKKFVVLDPLTVDVILLLCGLFLYSIMNVSIIIYCEKFNLLKSWNLRIIFKYVGDFVVYNIVALLVSVLFSVVIVFPVWLVVKTMFGQGAFSYYYVAFVATFLILVLGNFYAQIHYETLSSEK